MMQIATNHRAATPDRLAASNSPNAFFRYTPPLNIRMEDSTSTKKMRNLRIPAELPALKSASDELIIPCMVPDEALEETPDLPAQSPSAPRLRPKSLLERRAASASTLTISLTTKESVAALSPTDRKHSTANVPAKSDAEKLEMLINSNDTDSVQQVSQIGERLSCQGALYDEFWNIPMNYPDRIPVAGCGPKNRYRTILANERTRVILRDRNDPVSAYINANFIKGFNGTPKSYIATQGPMSNTVDDFWAMVWGERASAIVMLCSVSELNRNKCSEYLPRGENVKEAYGPISVKVVQRTLCDGFVTRKLILENGSEMHQCTHYWYTEWVDHAIPKSAQSLLTLINLVDRVHVSSASKSINSLHHPGKRRGFNNRSPLKSPIEGFEALNEEVFASDLSEQLKSLSTDSSEMDCQADQPVGTSLKKLSSTTKLTQDAFFPPSQHIQRTKAASVSHCSSEQRMIDSKDQETMSKRLVVTEHNAVSRVLSDPYSETSKGDLPTLPLISSRFAHLTTPAPPNSPRRGSCFAATNLYVPASPPIVHCSAGIGRTGCFIAISHAINELRSQLPTDYPSVDILRIVASLRLDRGGMVQTQEQYEFIYKALLEFSKLSKS